MLDGIRRAEGIEIFHPDGTFTAHDTGTFTGTSSGSGNTGSGQLVGDRGTGPVITGPATAEGTYSAQLHGPWPS